MKKIKEFWNALGHVPKLFKLVYKTDKLYLIYILCETICFALVPYPAMYLSRYALDSIENRISFTEFSVVCILLVFIQLILYLLKSFFNSIRPQRRILVTGKLYNGFHMKCMELDYELLSEKEMQDLQKFSGDFVKYRLDNIIWNFISLFSCIIAIIYSCVLIADVNFILVLIVVLGLVAESLFSAKFIPERFNIDKEISQNSRYINYYNDIATNEAYAKDIRIFDMSAKIFERLSTYTKKNLVLENKKEKQNYVRSIATLSLSNTIDLIIYAVLGFLVLKGNITVGDLSFAVGNLLLFRSYISEVSNILVDYSEDSMHLEYYNQFMTLKSQFRRTGNKSISTISEENFTIEFKNVSFKYPGQDDYVLKDFNLTVSSREKISVVGENGAGKTTFIKLLMRLYEPTEGSILINGMDIREFDYDEYLSLFAPVFQDYKLFAFTVRENITSFSNSQNDALMISASEKSGIAERINELPYKYNTYLTKQFDENGVEFSGGEQQKIAIARTYYKNNALITILDEPTSALDPKAENRIYKQFNDLIGKNTAFFISHRLASTKFCDKIVVIKDKKVHEFGTFEELMANKSYYSALYEMQASYYTNEGV